MSRVLISALSLGKEYEKSRSQIIQLVRENELDKSCFVFQFMCGLLGDRLLSNVKITRLRFKPDGLHVRI